MALKLGSQPEQADLAKLAALARLVELPLPPLEEAVELASQPEPGLPLGQVEPPLLEEAGLPLPLEEAVELATQPEPGLPLGQVEPPLLEEAGLAQRSGSSLLAHRTTREYR